MNEGIKKIEAVIDAIERDVTAEINCGELASKMLLSVYEFRRIFAFVVGCPISEYVRRRRLSLAACELVGNPDASIRTISEKYGYSTEAAFSKAFREHHGVSPTSVQKGGCEIRIFTRPEFEFSVSGKSTVAFSIEYDKEFLVGGLSMPSPYSDTCCCEAVWGEFYERGIIDGISTERVYAVYRDDGECVMCTIGERCDDARGDEECTRVCAGRWACFKMNTTDDEVVNRKYKEFLYEVLPSSGLTQRADTPLVEVFPRDMEKEGFEWEIRIPIN